MDRDTNKEGLRFPLRYNLIGIDSNSWGLSCSHSHTLTVFDRHAILKGEHNIPRDISEQYTSLWEKEQWGGRVANLSRLSEEQNSLALSAPQSQQRLHHYQLSWALPKAKVFLLGEMVLWDSPQQPGATWEEVGVVADLAQCYQTRENLREKEKQLYHPRKPHQATKRWKFYIVAPLNK